jgi:hypothetical protein
MNINLEEWNKKLDSVNVNKASLNKLLLNYFAIMGYRDAAQAFALESNTIPNIHLDSITDRMLIRNLIQSGNIQQAVEKVNDLESEILDTNPKLYFHLQLQKLVELIKNENIKEAIEFAQQQLTHVATEHPSFLDEFEKTMALLAFDNVSNCPISYLVGMEQRQKTASELNAAILAFQCQEKDPKLPQILKMLIWAQKELEKKSNYPKITNLVTTDLELTNKTSE